MNVRLWPIADTCEYKNHHDVASANERLADMYRIVPRYFRKLNYRSLQSALRIFFRHSRSGVLRESAEHSICVAVSGG